MSDIFLCHVEEDAELVTEVAAGLENAGYTTWRYERDSLPGIPYVRQIPDVIDEAKAVVIVISINALASPHVDREIHEAYRGEKHLFPLLHGLTHFEFRQHRRDWALMLGAAVFVTVPTTGVSATVPRLIAGMQQMGVHPSGAIASTPRPPLEHPPEPRATTRPSPHDLRKPEPERTSDGIGTGAQTTGPDREGWIKPGSTKSAVTQLPMPPRTQTVTRRNVPREKQSPRRWRARNVVTTLILVGSLCWLTNWVRDGSEHVSISEWNRVASGKGPSATIEGDQLTITIPHGSKNSDSSTLFGDKPGKTEPNYGYTFGSGLKSPCKLRGNFDIQVAFELPNWPMGNGVRVGLVTKADRDQSVERTSRSQNETDDRGYTESWAFTTKVETRPQITTFGPAYGESGILRLTRTDNTMQAYVEDQSGRTLRRSFGSGWTGDTEVYLAAWSHNYILQGTVKVRFYDFEVIDGNWECD